MKHPRLALAALLVVLVWQTAASGQMARFVRADAFDSGCLKSGQFVQVTYFLTDEKQNQTKGYVKAVGSSSFTLSRPVDQVEISFQDIEILVIGRLKPHIILLKHRPVVRDNDRVRRTPNLEPPPQTLAYG